MKRGRPTKYREEHCQEIISYMAQGFSKEAFAGHIGVSSQQIYRWKKKHKAFRTAIKKAETACQNFWEELGIQLVLAGQGNATAWIFNMKNRFRKTGWSDTSEVKKTIYRPKTLLHALHNNNSDGKAVETTKEN
jgi:transposase-like protein